MGEEGSAGLEFLDISQRAFEMGVAWMRLTSESIEDEDVQILKQRYAFGRDVAHVGEVGCGAEAIAGDGLVAVRDGNPLKACTEEIDPGSGRAFIEGMDGDACGCGVAFAGAEGVVEDSREGLRGFFIRVERQVLFQPEAERPQIVKTKNVVGVAMGIKNGVDVTNVLADGLCVEVRTGIDEDNAVVVGEAKRGRVRRLRGSPSGETAEAHTAQSQPSVGTPIEVPVPRKVRVASIRECGSPEVFNP